MDDVKKSLLQEVLDIKKTGECLNTQKNQEEEQQLRAYEEFQIQAAMKNSTLGALMALKSQGTVNTMYIHIPPPIRFVVGVQRRNIV